MPILVFKIKNPKPPHQQTPNTMLKVTTDAKISMMSEPKLPPEPESMRKLRALKERIIKEHDSERAEREAMQTGEPVLPLSLASEADTQSYPSKAAPPILDRQGNDTLTVLKDKIQHLKIDRSLQRELEVELEARFSELGGLKSQNRRLRDILALRESSNTRKEAKLEDEIACAVQRLWSSALRAGGFPAVFRQELCIS